MKKIENPVLGRGVEKIKRKYIYKDYSGGKKGEVIFECETEGGILEADKLYEEKIGQNPSKQSSVACSFENVETKS